MSIKDILLSRKLSGYINFKGLPGVLIKVTVKNGIQEVQIENSYVRDVQLPYLKSRIEAHEDLNYTSPNSTVIEKIWNIANDVRISAGSKSTSQLRPLINFDKNRPSKIITLAEAKVAGSDSYVDDSNTKIEWPNGQEVIW